MKPMTDTTLALALALDGTASPATDEIKRLSGIAGLVDALPDPEIDQRFVARLEATLMAEFDAKFGEAAAPLHIVKAEPKIEANEERTAPNVIALPQRRFVVRRALAGMVAAAMLSALPVVAAASSLPGSPFFGVERWRQNHAISSAHGAAKAFLVEQTARKWIGYGSQMAIVGYDVSDIESVLAHAGRLQTQAATLIARVGTPGEIAKMAGMLADDVTRLQGILPQTRVSARPAVHDAIQTASDLTRRLVGSLRTADGAPVVVPGTEEIVASDPSTSTSTTSNGGSGATTKPADTSTGSDKPLDGNETSREYWEDYDRAACHIIGREQVNDLLVGPSGLICQLNEVNPGA